MSIDLVLKPSCGACGSTAELYGSSCKHLTLCVTCGKSMAEKCGQCGTPITRLIREYNVCASLSNDKNYFIGSFASGLPSFKKNENKWSLQKESLKGRQVTEALREKFKNRPWLLEDETGQFQYRGHLEGTEATTYYVLMCQRKELIAFPACSWYSFNKVAQYKQLTLEEAEEIMRGRRLAAEKRHEWMTKKARSGAAAFGIVEKPDDREGAGGGGRRRKKDTGDDDKAIVADRGEEDEEEEAERMSRLWLNESSGDDGNEEVSGGGDFDDNDDGGDDDIRKGDWEYEEIFSDDDEAIGELEDLDPETEPPEIKQDDEDEDDEEWGLEGLSISGKELKKLLGRALKDYIPEHGKVDMEGDISKKEAPMEKPVDNSSPIKVTTSVLKAPSTSKSSKGKKSSREESRKPSGAALKKLKIKLPHHQKLIATAKLNSGQKAPEFRDAFTATKGRKDIKDFH